MGGEPGLALVELSVVEQRYRAVLDAAAGVPVTGPKSRHRLRTRRRLPQRANPAPVPADSQGQLYCGGPVEFERAVPASGNMQVARRQFWLGPHRSGMTVTFWAGTDVIHLSIGGARIKSLRSHLSAATWPAWPLREDGLPGRRPCPRPSPAPRSRSTGSSPGTALFTSPVSTSRRGKSSPAARSASASRTRP